MLTGVHFPLHPQGLKSKPESAKDDVKAAGDNIQSAAGKTGDAAQDKAHEAEDNVHSAVRPESARSSADAHTEDSMHAISKHSPAVGKVYG